MRFEGNITATATASMRVKSIFEAKVFGDEGRILCDFPWHVWGKIVVKNNGDGWSIIEPDKSRSLFTYEIESFTREMRAQPVGASEVAMRFDDTLGNMKALDRWRAEIGLRYEGRPGEGRGERKEE